MGGTFSGEAFGRADDRVRIRGQGVDLAAVERAFVGIHGVREAVVTPVPDPRGDTRLVAHVVPDPEVAVAARDLRNAVAYRLPAYAVPSRFRLLDAFPRTDRDDLDRDALAAAAAAGLDETDYVAPRDEFEARVAAIVAEVLAVEQVGTTHDLFDTGADSLAVVELINTLEDEFDCDISALLVDADEQPIATVAGIAEFLRGGHMAKRDGDSLVRLSGRDASAGPPVFLVPGIGGNPIQIRDLARLLAPHRVYSMWPHGHLQRALPDQSVAAIARRFVAALTAREPDGPIVLGGYSFGAFVAYEMARQLRAAGRDVPLLVNFDTPFDGRDDSTAAKLERYAQRLASTATDEESGSQLGRLRRVGRMLVDSVVYRVDRAVLITTVGIAHRSYSEQSRAFVAHHARVLRRFRPKGYGGRTLVVVANSRGESEPELGWREALAGPIDSVRVPGDHATLTRAPQVDAVARAVAAAIDRAEAQVL